MRGSALTSYSLEKKEQWQGDWIKKSANNNRKSLVEIGAGRPENKSTPSVSGDRFGGGELNVYRGTRRKRGEKKTLTFHTPGKT